MYADNKLISQRQLFRQMVTGLLGIYLLAAPVTEGLVGRQGILALFIGMVFYLSVGIYFIRIKTVFQKPEKYMGKMMGKILIFLYLSWIWKAGVYLLLMIAGITDRFLIEGSISWAVILVSALFAYLGSHQGLERRGRMAEVCFPLLLVILAGMPCLAIMGIKPEYLMETSRMTFGSLAQGVYRVISLYLPFMFLPITLGNVEKAGKSGKTISLAMLLVTAFLAGALVLLRGCFGAGGYEHKEYPMIDLMAGVRFPGGFLERGDVFWTAALLFSVLFALGSVFFYNHELLLRVQKERITPFFAVFIAGMAVVCEKWNISAGNFIKITEKLYAPLFFLLLLYVGFAGKKKAAAKAMAVFLCLSLLSGCGIALEDRVFPLSMSADYADGMYEIIYGIPGLGTITGQDKKETGGNEPQAAGYRGRTMKEAEEHFNQNQEKYLDRGHIKTLILGKGLLENREALEAFLDYLEEQPSVGAGMYVFSSPDIPALMSLEMEASESVGDYLSGMLEHNPKGKKKNAAVLQDLYNARHRGEKFPRLLEVTVVNKKPRLGEYS